MIKGGQDEIKGLTLTKHMLSWRHKVINNQILYFINSEYSFILYFKILKQEWIATNSILDIIKCGKQENMR